MKPGRVTRSCIVAGSWQSMQATGWVDELARLGVGHLVHRLEALDRGRRRRASCTARRPTRGSGCRCRAAWLTLLALGEGLVVEHVGVAALLAEVRGEGVAGPHRLEARVLLEPRLRDDRARIGVGRACAAPPRCRRSACAAGRRCAGSRRTGAGSSCPRPPGPRSRRSSSTTRKNGFLRLLLALEDVDEQRRDPAGQRRRPRRR